MKSEPIVELQTKPKTVKYESNVELKTECTLETDQNPTIPSAEEMKHVFKDCKTNKWDSLYDRIHQNPWIAITPIHMENNILTTVMHQAITSKGSNIDARVRVILKILEQTPQAAQIRNGYGSLPLHVVCQRNTKLKAKAKDILIRSLIAVYKEALVKGGGQGGRTPIHIIFTDYVSPHLTQFMIENGREALRKKDSVGWLPIHIACSRHCSPDKLLMLLEGYPESLYAVTNANETPLQLAKKHSTNSHPNHNLIKELMRNMEPTRINIPLYDIVPRQRALKKKLKKKNFKEGKSLARAPKNENCPRKRANDTKYDEVGDTPQLVASCSGSPTSAWKFPQEACMPKAVQPPRYYYVGGLLLPFERPVKHMRYSDPESHDDFASADLLLNLARAAGSAVQQVTSEERKVADKVEKNWTPDEEEHLSLARAAESAVQQINLEEKEIKAEDKAEESWIPDEEEQLKVVAV